MRDPVRTTHATVEATRPECAATSLMSLRLDAVGPRRVLPGTVATISVSGVGEGYFALASSPDALPRAEVLVKRGGAVADALLALTPGARISVRGPVGHGFDLDACKGRSLALIGVGSAIAPLRSALLYALARRADYDRVAVVYGVRRPEDLCFRSEWPAWEAAGVELHPVVSGSAAGPWKGRRGRIQLHLDEALVGFGGGVALVCGMPPMMDETAASLGELGFRRRDILRNY